VCAQERSADEPGSAAPRAQGRERVLSETGEDLGSVRAPGKPAFCWSCVLVAGGTALVIGAIPLAVVATKLASRGDGVDAGRAILGCATASTELCGALGAVDTDFVPYAVGAGIMGGLGIVSIASGAILEYAVPARDGGGVSFGVAPAAGGATFRFQATF